MRTKYKPWAKPYLDEHQEVQYPFDELKKLSHLHLEVGCGKGAFIIEMAKRNPDTFFLAIEKNVTCAGISAKALIEEDIKNAKLMYIDGDLVIDELNEESVKILYLNFSDPWPKKRHEKRRLTSLGFINKYIRILEKGGEIRFKTDNDDLYQFSKECFAQSTLKVVEDIEDYQELASDDCMTEYESRKREAGLKIHRIILRKE